MSEENRTTSVKCSSLRKGEYILIKGKPCKILETTTSACGKHGHGKIRFVALDIFTGAKMESCHPSTHQVTVPNIKTCDYQLTYIGEDGRFTLMNDVGLLFSHLVYDPVSCDKSLEEITKWYEACEEDDFHYINVKVIEAMGMEAIKDANKKNL